MGRARREEGGGPIVKPSTNGQSAYSITCCRCGTESTLVQAKPARHGTMVAAVWREPPGWRRIPIYHWPPGFGCGPIVVRICDGCWKKADPKKRMDEMVDALEVPLPEPSRRSEL